MGYDYVSMDLIKDCAHLICRPITHIIDLSLTSGIVPDQLKITRVIPDGITFEAVKKKRTGHLARDLCQVRSRDMFS